MDSLFTASASSFPCCISFFFSLLANAQLVSENMREDTLSEALVEDPARVNPNFVSSGQLRRGQTSILCYVIRAGCRHPSTCTRCQPLGHPPATATTAGHDPCCLLPGVAGRWLSAAARRGSPLASWLACSLTARYRAAACILPGQRFILPLFSQAASVRAPSRVTEWDFSRRSSLSPTSWRNSPTPADVV